MICGYCGASNALSHKEIRKIIDEINPYGTSTGSLAAHHEDQILIETKIKQAKKRKLSIMDLPYASDHDQEGITPKERAKIITESWPVPWERPDKKEYAKATNSMLNQKAMFMAFTPIVKEYIHPLAISGYENKWASDVNDDGQVEKIGWFRRWVQKKKEKQKYEGVPE